MSIISPKANATASQTVSLVHFVLRLSVREQPHSSSILSLHSLVTCRVVASTTCLTRRLPLQLPSAPPSSLQSQLDARIPDARCTG